MSIVRPRNVQLRHIAKVGYYYVQKRGKRLLGFVGASLLRILRARLVSVSTVRKRIANYGPTAPSKTVDNPATRSLPRSVVSLSLLVVIVVGRVVRSSSPSSFNIPTFVRSLFTRLFVLSYCFVGVGFVIVIVGFATLSSC